MFILMTISIGRAELNYPDPKNEREWLVTNGIGGFACGTLSGMLTRRYHGYLVAALTPPLGRTLLATKFDEAITYHGAEYHIFSNSWSADSIWTKGYNYLDQFRLEGTTPVWTYLLGDALIEKRIWMEQGANTTYVKYDVIRAQSPLVFDVKGLVNHRDYHDMTRKGWQMNVRSIVDGVAVTAREGAAPFYLRCDTATAQTKHDWYRNYYLAIEDYRGESYREDHLFAAEFNLSLKQGESATFVASTEKTADLDGTAAYQRQKAHEQTLLTQAGEAADDDLIAQLVLAADQFIVARPLANNPDGRSVIAGYPWFSDWGRDTMIALPGLTLNTGRSDVAAQILRTFAQFVDQGMLPNRFPDDSEQPEYNTVDATLWYFEAIKAYYNVTADTDLIRELYPVLQEIISWHQRGTRYNIRQVDDGLLYAGMEGVQLTWMDAKMGDWVVTPRIGKCVEINALWYNALMIMAELAAVVGEKPALYKHEARRVRGSFGRFWHEELGYCYDVIDGAYGHEPLLRPNQLFAISLTHSPLTPAQQKAVVDICAQHLLTPHGMRSLAPLEADYVGIYGGDRVERDGGYHQGTTWSWLLGAFVAAHLKVYGDRAQARSYLAPLMNHLQSGGGCVGSISEIFDGDAPWTPRGCFAQAWGVSELLRAWQLTAETG